MNDHLTSEDEIDLQELFSLFWSRKWFILTFVTSLTALLSIYIYRMPNIYQSNVVIMFKQARPTTDAIQSMISGAMTAADTTETELELIKSRRFVADIVNKLELHTRYEFEHNLSNSKATPAEIRELKIKLTVDKVIANISVSQKSGTNLISISYRSVNPYLAAEIANELGNSFIIFKEELMAGKQASGSKVLDTKIQDVKLALEKAELKIVEYQNENDFIDIKTALLNTNTKLTHLHKEKHVLESEIEQSKILKNHIVKSQGDVDLMVSLPQIASSKVVNAIQVEIKQHSQSFAKLKLRYGPKHPKYIAASKLLFDAKESLANELDKHVSKIDNELTLLRKNLLYVDKNIEQNNDRLKRLGVIEFDYQKLKREFDANLSLYEALIMKKNESDLLKDLTDTSNTILVERAHVNMTPVKPNRNLMMVLTALGSTLVACFIILMEIMLGDKLLFIKRLANKFDTKIIGVVPKLKLKRKDKKKVIAEIDHEKHASFLEAIRTIRTNILLDKKRSKQKVIAITSVNPNDGKSTLSIQLAESFAELENVVLVDADLRYPSIGEALGASQQAAGLTNLIAKSHNMEKVLSELTSYKYDVITSGTIPKNPLLFLSNSRLQKIIKYLSSKYKRVILECPPIMSVSDAFIISKHVDSVYLVVNAENANKDILTNVLEELKQADVYVGGILVNKVKENKNNYTNKYYGGRNYQRINKAAVG